MSRISSNLLAKMSDALYNCQRAELKTSREIWNSSNQMTSELASSRKWQAAATALLLVAGGTLSIAATYLTGAGRNHMAKASEVLGAAGIKGYEFTSPFYASTQDKLSTTRENLRAVQGESTAHKNRFFDAVTALVKAAEKANELFGQTRSQISLRA